MRRRKCGPPPSVQGPDPNVLAHAVMDEAIERLDPQPAYEEEDQRSWADLLTEACKSAGILVVRMA